MNKNIALLAIVSVAAIMTIGAVAPALAGEPAEEEPIALLKAGEAVAKRIAQDLQTNTDADDKVTEANTERGVKLQEAQDQMCAELAELIENLKDIPADASDIETIANNEGC